MVEVRKVDAEIARQLSRAGDEIKHLRNRPRYRFSRVTDAAVIIKSHHRFGGEVVTADAGNVSGKIFDVGLGDGHAMTHIATYGAMFFRGVIETAPASAALRGINQKAWLFYARGDFIGIRRRNKKVAACREGQS